MRFLLLVFLFGCGSSEFQPSDSQALKNDFSKAFSQDYNLDIDVWDHRIEDSISYYAVKKYGSLRGLKKKLDRDVYVKQLSNKDYIEEFGERSSAVTVVRDSLDGLINLHTTIYIKSSIEGEMDKEYLDIVVAHEFNHALKISRHYDCREGYISYFYSTIPAGPDNQNSILHKLVAESLYHSEDGFILVEEALSNLGHTDYNSSTIDYVKSIFACEGIVND
jgi:hypothetical protein